MQINSLKLTRWSERLGLAAGALSALYLVPTTSQAAVREVNSTPLSMSYASSSGYANGTYWDVDGLGGADWNLWNRLFVRSGSGSGTAWQELHLGAAGLNGIGFVRPAGGGNAEMRALGIGVVVGPTLAGSLQWGGQLGAYNAVVTQYSSIVANGGMSPGDNFVGFRFKNGTNIHYGYALVNVNSAAGSATIVRWAYNDVANAAISVGATATPVPEPGTASLALLGLGAAGLRGWRARRQKQAAMAA